MGKPLIVVESPAKAATIQKYLQGEYDVEASAGHVKDLPEGSLGVDVQKDFEPRFVVMKGKKRILDHLRKKASQAPAVFLAPDPDREGEAIAAHIAEEVRKVTPRVVRVLFHEITRDAVRKALESPREVDQRMVHSQLARRILDRLVGYQISPILWKKVQGGLSAGRVQSVAVRLVVDREREIEAFVPREYWVLTADLGRTPPRESQGFSAVLRRIDGKKADVPGQAAAEDLMGRLRQARWVVSHIERKDRKRAAPPPYITSTLQQDASRLLRFSPAHTMAVAQRLYEGVELGEEGRVGLITYMRTDSVRLSQEALKDLRDFIREAFGDAFVPARANLFRNRRSAQDAHEAIRPTAVARRPSEVRRFLDRDEARLYGLIWARALASQMTPAIYDQTVVDVEAGPAEFRAAGSVLRFEGYLAAWRFEKEPERDEPAVEEPEPSEEEEGVVGMLPPDLQEGEDLLLRDLRGEQRFTEPPPRFSEAALVRELEERGIGRPSTYASIVSAIQGKEYVVKHEGRLRPTELGRVVTDLLVQHFPGVVDYQFTARMEESLDRIEEGEMDHLALLREFWADFEELLKRAVREMRSVKAEAVPAGIDCDRCGKPMLIRFGKNGTFLGCSGYPACRNTREFVRDGNGKVAPKEVESPGQCPKCGKDLQVRSGRFGRFVACTGYPDCDYKRAYTMAEQCPVAGCSGHLVEKRSRKGKVFFGCDRYPECRFVTSYRPQGEACPQCGAPTVFLRSFRGGRTVLCLRENCGWSRRERSQGAAAEGAR
ncbi:type I DNA topoisomerase [Myxococcota bacterium]|nr:type I DNA topoisomerase [Myxococcota bacterium]